MIIDCHGHYTLSPRQHEGWRNEQIVRSFKWSEPCEPVPIT